MKCPDCNSTMKAISCDESGYCHFWCSRDGIYLKIDTLSNPVNKVYVFRPNENATV